MRSSDSNNRRRMNKKSFVSTATSVTNDTRSSQNTTKSILQERLKETIVFILLENG